MGFQHETTSCKVDSGAGCFVLLYMYKTLFGVPGLSVPTVNNSAYGNTRVHNLGSFILCIHMGNRLALTVFQVTYVQSNIMHSLKFLKFSQDSLYKVTDD